MNPIGIAIVEDNQEILASLQRIIARSPNLRCVCSCATGTNALQTIPQHRPEVVVMDLQLPDISGIECTARLRDLAPESRVLVYTVYAESERVFHALEAGACGYLLKSSTTAEIVEAITDVNQGGAPMTGEIARKVVEFFRKPRTSPSKEGEGLSAREEEILHLLARGFVTKEIADKLEISFDTVRFHLKNIYAKLHVRSRTEAVLKHLSRKERVFRDGSSAV
jgi:DNA-binding NarL/FixJ family response regulator